MTTQLEYIVVQWDNDSNTEIDKVCPGLDEAVDYAISVWGHLTDKEKLKNNVIVAYTDINDYRVCGIIENIIWSNGDLIKNVKECRGIKSYEGRRDIMIVLSDSKKISVLNEIIERYNAAPTVYNYSFIALLISMTYPQFESMIVDYDKAIFRVIDMGVTA